MISQLGCFPSRSRVFLKTHTPMNKKALLFLISALALFVTMMTADAKSKTASGIIQLQAVDAEGRPLQNLVAGKYVRLDASASFENLPPKAVGKVNFSATFSTSILGRKVSYTLKLPVSGSAGSSLDPSVGVPTSGQPLDATLPAKTFREILDFQIPPETPAGKLTLTVFASATSATPLKRSFTFNVVRP
jgi:hypothetical protein